MADQTNLLQDNRGQVPKEKRIKHYTDSHRILLVGEGDFSFAACLAEVFGSAVDMVATSFDSRDTLKRLYNRASVNLENLERLGCTILHGVDAHTMSRNPILRDTSFDRIVFNFPHAGFLGPERLPYQIELHRHLVRGFLKNAKLMLTKDGEIHVTHKTNYPFIAWRIEELGEEEGLLMVERACFRKSDYPGYNNKRGDGAWCDRTFRVGECSTFKFVAYPGSLYTRRVGKKNSLRKFPRCSKVYPPRVSQWEIDLWETAETDLWETAVIDPSVYTEGWETTEADLWEIAQTAETDLWETAVIDLNVYTEDWE